MAATLDRLEFENGRGQTLAAAVDRPRGTPRAWAIFAHCFTCSKDLAAAGRIGRALATAGIGVLRFDFTGLGASEGDLADETFSSNVDDLLAAADHLRGEGHGPSVLVGHSLGGAAVLVAAPRIPEVKAVVTVGAPGDPAHVTELLRDSLGLIEREGVAEVSIAGRSFPISQSFVDDLRGQSIAEALEAYEGALLVCHAPRDEVVGVDHAAAIFKAARHPKSFVSLDDADHLLTRREDAVYLARVLDAWVSRFLPDGTAEPPGEEEGRVHVTELGPPYAQSVTAGGHVLVADEPAKVGGGDRGPAPYDLLLAALGACTAMTLRMYANRKEWPLDGVSVSLTHERIHASDCASCETSEGRVDRLTREITLRGPLDDAQRDRLVEIADRCPVHRTLEREKEIVTRLA